MHHVRLCRTLWRRAISKSTGILRTSTECNTTHTATLIAQTLNTLHTTMWAQRVVSSFLQGPGIPQDLGRIAVKNTRRSRHSIGRPTSNLHSIGQLCGETHGAGI